MLLNEPSFEHAEPQVWDEGGTYVETDAAFVHNTTHSWNRGLGEIVTALIEAGLTITGLVEHDTVPCDALRGHMRQVETNEWQLSDRPGRLPHTYTLQAVRNPV